MDFSNRKILYGGIAAVVVIALVAIVAWPRYSHNNQVDTCAASAYRPDVKTITKQNFATEDGKILANLAGYVELIGEGGKSFLPLDISSVKSVTGAQGTTVTFTGECVSVDVSYSVAKVESVDQYKYQGIDMEIKHKNANEFESICLFDEPFVFTQSIPNYYTCKKEQSHQCSTKVDDKTTKVVANLVLVSFEMEFDRQNDAKKGEFEKEPWEASCEKWEK